MSVFTADVPSLYPQVMVGTVHPNGALNNLARASLLDSTWPTANLALFFPIRVTELYTFSVLFVISGAATLGNVDVGLYTLDGNRIISTGAQGHFANGTVGAFVSSTTITPGVYYLAVACDNTTASFYMSSLVSAYSGVRQMAAAFPLPATATLASATGTNFPVVAGMSARSFI